MGLDWGGSQLPSRWLCVFEVVSGLWCGIQLCPRRVSQRSLMHLPSMYRYVTRDMSGVHRRAKPRARSLLTMLGTWIFSSCAGRGTQLPTFKGLVCKINSAQGYLCHQRREHVQLGVEMQDIFSEGTACPPLRQTVTCGSGSQIKKKLMKLTENTNDFPLLG